MNHEVGCTSAKGVSKKPFGSRSEAKAYNRKMRRTAKHPKQYPYKCHTCGAWHLCSRKIVRDLDNG